MSDQDRLEKLEIEVAALRRLLVEYLGAEAELEEDELRAQHRRYRQMVRQRREARRTT